MSTQRFSNAMTRFDERGSVTIIVAFMFTVLLLCIGGAIDIARWTNARTVSMSALDAAVLAGGRSLQIHNSDPAAAILVAQQTYVENTKNRIPLASETVTFQVTDSNTALTATGDAKLATTLLNIIGVNSLPVLSATGTKFPIAKISVGGGSGSDLELAVMLDVTGSMCADGEGPCTSSPKLDALKAATKDLVNTVIWADQSTYKSRVALVPFSTRIRVAPDNNDGSMMQKLTGLPPTWSGYMQICTAWTGSGASETGGNWTCTASQTQYMSNWKILPCVTDRFYSTTNMMDLTDDKPGTNAWLNAHGGDRMTLSWDSSDTAATSQRGLTASDPAYDWNYDSAAYCSDVAEGNQIMSLTNDKTALAARIDALEAYGSTSGALGTAWAWYTLSPKWTSVWGGNDKPGPYSDLTTIQGNGLPKLRKVAVLMTDGVYNTWRGWKDQDQQAVSDYAKQLCTNMKAQGIEIYTVGFALDELTPTERAIATDTLQSCGTDLQHFYETLTLPQLQQAFKSIALQMSTLYLAQ